jgi:hypothetical protein
MTPEELNNALQSAALTYVQEVKQRDVLVRVHQELAVDIIRTKQYQHRDETIPHLRSPWIHQGATARP